MKGRQNVAPLPESVKPRDAAALGVVALTAYQAIVPFVKAGDRVLVNGGSGGVGTFAIQIAKAFGCYVSVTCSGANAELVRPRPVNVLMQTDTLPFMHCLRLTTCDQCRNLGADDIIDYRTVSPVEALQQRGTQYALILDAVGTPALYYSAHHYLAPDGVFNTIAIDPTSFASIRQTALMFLLPRFLWGGRRKINFIGAKADSEVFARLARMMKEGRIRTLVEQEYALEQVGEAFARLKTGRTRGKIIVRVSQ